jgi:hypothetical protein
VTHTIVTFGLALLLSGCWIGEGGMPLPRQHAGETYPGDRRELSGVLEVSDFGCLNIALDGETYLVIWPAGSDYADLGDGPPGVQLPGGQAITEGDSLVGIGTLTPTEPLLANRDTSLAYAIRGCAPDASEVIVFDTADRGS